VSNLGLSHLIAISIPVLTAIYPPCIVLVLLSFTLSWWNKNTRIIAPTMLVSLLFGIVDAIKTTGWKDSLPAFAQHLPLAEQGLAWLPPSLAMLVLVAVYDRVSGGREQVSAQQK
jgi:LIVCS family branched-chain amino acid:cation transporter